MGTTTGHTIGLVDGVSLARADEAAEGSGVKSMPVSENGLSVELLEELAALAAEKTAAGGLRLMGEGGILPELAQHLMQAALEAEMDLHLAEESARAGGRGSRSGGNMRNGYRAKKVMTEVGPVVVNVPRDRLGTFRPGLLPKYARRTGALDEMVLSLTGKGLTSGEIVAHLAEVYGMATSKETVSTITDKALESMAEWRTRPLDSVYPVVFIDAIHVRIRDGQVANRPVYVAIAVTADGYREILGLWTGQGGEGAKYWQTVLTEIRNRGVKDVLMLVCDGLTALPEAVGAIWPQTVVQTCVVHLIRNSMRYASRRDTAEIARDLKPVYTAVDEAQARRRLTEFGEKWDSRYPSISGIWERSWNEFVPFLSLPPAIRQVVYTTNAIESLNARYRRAAQACGHFPNETAALKRLYLATLALDPTGRGRQRWNNRWKAALNEFDVLFDGRLTANQV
ncbi:IS256 family transposase [Streptomyces adustus]|uniref:IS256 family transposase n=2 Tax=Streptomyces adustus TaxID=1609272 RepID=A0A5N8VKB4_9ACTN|nr:IS256 family transposase [Streptomyces adustus]MPY35693.1 IS256 family transposase [Streptomyces adustus]